MENNLISIATDYLPIFLKNIRFSIHLKGWPAAITAVAFCGSCVAIYGLKTYCEKDDSKKE